MDAISYYCLRKKETPSSFFFLLSFPAAPIVCRSRLNDLYGRTIRYTFTVTRRRLCGM